MGSESDSLTQSGQRIRLIDTIHLGYKAITGPAMSKYPQGHQYDLGKAIVGIPGFIRLWHSGLFQG